jgi:ABC-type antimicrobial peptide transport system permease subunit
MKEGAVLVAVGTAIGLAGAWAGARLVSSAQSVAAKAIATPSSPLVLVGIPAMLAGLALLACYVPARRSLRIDPVVALRQE